MGGWGSGKRWQGRDTTAGYLRLDVRKLQRDGTLERRYSFSWQWSRNGEPVGNINIHPEADRVILSYRDRRSDGGDWTAHEYPVLLERTRCNYGGERVWFLCPARGCGRRVAILYGGSIFACRRCYGLAYPSQNEPVSDRADARAWAIRERCGGIGCLLDPLMRPRGMHQKTFQRLNSRYEWETRRSAMSFAARTGMSEKEVLAFMGIE